MNKKLLCALLFQSTVALAAPTDKDLTNHSIDLGSSLLSLQSDAMYSLMYGYHFNSTWAVNIMRQQGDFSTSEDRFSSTGISVTASIPISQKWYGYARLGVARYSATYTIDPTAVVFEQQSESGNSTFSDIGFEYLDYDGIGVGFGYREQDFGDVTLDPGGVFFDLSYHF